MSPSLRLPAADFGLPDLLPMMSQSAHPLADASRRSRYSEQRKLRQVDRHAGTQAEHLRR
jgi:hypothetical protein